MYNNKTVSQQTVAVYADKLVIQRAFCFSLYNQWPYSYKTDSLLNNCNEGGRKSLNTTMTVTTTSFASLSQANVVSVDSFSKAHKNIESLTT